MTDYYERMERDAWIDAEIYPAPSLQDNTRYIKMQQAQEYALSIIEANKECFVAHWIMQNTDKNLDDYTLCYCYQGDAIKFWMGEKTK